ncbi:thioesterase II family protein [Actinoplanes awajinensis]|uniref:Thioesterase domain-containing protein n=1 Tax=Actinoplanes awajinensis subsp. mycoplanecinus TaxID=135947 RepID=A0A0X3V828_9ACTN|nr:alpha/beta fold hydrolase [Actinoplanes awajinensis]KUL39426.1 hypothetical protein ADL15_09740 [Actinoplanes awajinensis subsp. mycoplanecinus]WKD80528.1 Thioesterase [Actinoplanes awajinensis subsp. mycoplanecinus]
MMNVSSPATRWLRRFRPVDFPVERIICFPHAGGAASYFRSWPAWLPEKCELLAVQYPGRQDRVQEPCIRDMKEMVETLVPVLAPLRDRPLVFFGHSMGAAIAYETAVDLERTLDCSVRLLAVSSREAPDSIVPRDLHRQSDEALVDDIKKLGGFEPEIFDVPELRALVLPTVRADYQLIETYQPSLHKLRAPIAAYAGNLEAELLPDGLEAWAHCTQAGFWSKLFGGDHFYLQKNEESLVQDLVRRTRE